MSEQESVASALETVASNPKVATVVSAVTGVMGTVSVVSSIQTVLGVISMVISCAVGIYVLWQNRIKTRIYQRMWETGENFKE